MDKRTAHISSWPAPEGTPPLQSDEIHVWRASLEIAAEEVLILGNTLTAEETGRAGRFRFEKDRSRFVAARGILRNLLGRYLNIRPGDVRFVYGQYGKPELSREKGTARICFNVSHSHGLALFAFALNREIGVDIECIQPGPQGDNIAGRFFAPAEIEALGALPPPIRQEAFFTCWTRKEAFLKANGMGISFGLDRVEVSVTPRGPAVLIRIDNSPDEAAQWSLFDLPAGKEYAAALAVKQQDPELRLYQWAGSFSV